MGAEHLKELLRGRPGGRPIAELPRLDGGQHLVLLLRSEGREALSEAGPRRVVDRLERHMIEIPLVGLLVGERLVDEVDAARFDGSGILIGGDDPAGDRLHELPLALREDQAVGGMAGRLEGQRTRKRPQEPEAAPAHGAAADELPTRQPEGPRQPARKRQPAHHSAPFFASLTKWSATRYALARMVSVGL